MSYNDEARSVFSCRLASFLLLMIVLFLGPGLLAGDTVIATSEAPLEGRLFDRATDRPLADAHVFAVSPEKKLVLGHTMTSREPGPDKGTWALNGLPSQGEILLIGFHEKSRENIWIQRYALTGKYNDLSLVYTNGADNSKVTDPELKAIWSQLVRARWVKKEPTAETANVRAIELADGLLGELRKQAAKRP